MFTFIKFYTYSTENNYQTYDDKEACDSSKNEHHFSSFHIILAEQFDFMGVTYFHILRSCVVWEHESYIKAQNYWKL
jgi:hypothetical protein